AIAPGSSTDRPRRFASAMRVPAATLARDRDRGRACSSFTPSGDRRRRIEREETYGPHQGSEAGPDLEARQERPGHGLDRGPGRDADAPDRGAHRASADAPE